MHYNTWKTSTLTAFYMCFCWGLRLGLFKKHRIACLHLLFFQVFRMLQDLIALFCKINSSKFRRMFYRFQKLFLILFGLFSHFQSLWGGGCCCLYLLGKRGMSRSLNKVLTKKFFFVQKTLEEFDFRKMGSLLLLSLYS